MSTAISLSALLKELARLPALVIGPGATSHAGIADDIGKTIADRFGLKSYDDSCPNYMKIIDGIATSEARQLSEVKEFTRKCLCDAVPSPAIPSLASVRWSAIASLAPDSTLEDALRLKYDSSASSWSITIIDSAEISPFQRTVPIYKLLGNPRDLRTDQGPVLDSSSLLMRKPSWARILDTFSDHVREAPVLVLGNDSNRDLLGEFFAALFSLRAPHPKKFLFLAGESIKDDPIVASLLQGRAKMLEVDATLKQFCNAVADFSPSPVQLTLSLPEIAAGAKKLLENELRPFSPYLEVVPHEVPADFDPRTRAHELVDGLFRPTTVDWNPYLFDYYLPRSQATELTTAIADYSRSSPLTRLASFVLRGDAGSGKSCAMKQAATQLAESGFITLWLKRVPLDASRIVFRDLSRALSRVYKKLGKDGFPKIAIFCDEPSNLRVSPYDLAYELNAPNVPVLLVLSFRNTDLLSETGLSIPLPALPDVEIELSNDLDHEEVEALPALLLRVNAFADEAAARQAIAEMHSRNASDILCSLWYLVPETRATLSLALEDEYFRLGNSVTTVTGIAEEAARTFGEKARLAYECAAVCSGFQIGIPTEVLVRVLEISFEEWYEMCLSGKPLWGLIYPEENADTGDVVYVTRNEVVTTVLLRLLNGGLGHTGEYRRLLDLIAVCTVGTPPYRAFLIDLLVRNRRKLQDKFTLNQGMEIFALATQTFPYPDKTMEHHYGLWLKDQGADSTEAYQQLEKALMAPDYPHAQTSERPEHIHTSLAAVVLSQVREGSRTAESGLEAVREHLRLAQSPGFFNPHTTHVFGTLLLDLATMQRDSHTPSVTTLEAVGEAIPAIERALQVIGSGGAKMQRYSKDLEMLTGLQARILGSIDDVETLAEFAKELFRSTRSQIGFEVVARKLLYEASKKDRGRSYLKVKEYLDECFEICEKDGVQPRERLIAVRVDLYIRWQIQKTSGQVNWALIRDDLQRLLQSPWFRNDPIKMFYCAVALYHTDQITEANALFTMLRSTASVPNLKGSIRAYFLGREGAPKRYQGFVRRSHDRLYMEVGELGTDLPIYDGGSGLHTGASRHCYVGFSLNGPRAMLRRPEEGQTKLPI